MTVRDTEKTVQSGAVNSLNAPLQGLKESDTSLLLYNPAVTYPQKKDGESPLRFYVTFQVTAKNYQRNLIFAAIPNIRCLPAWQK